MLNIFPRLAGLISAAAAFLTAFVAAVFLYAILSGGVSWLTIAISFGIALASTPFSFLYVFLVAKRRYLRHKPAVGALRGGLLAIAVVISVAGMHALLLPGAGDRAASVIGQAFFVLATVGVAAFSVGAFVGMYIERFNTVAPNNSFKPKPLRASA